MTEIQWDVNRLYEEINVDVVKTLVKAIEAKDLYTAGHVWRVSQYTRLIAERLGWEDSQIIWIEAGAVLHDLGKVGISDLILQKESKLTDEEFDEMKKHPAIGYHIVEPSPFLSQFKNIIETHHERYDGKGYPKGLIGEQIPLEGRITGIADAFDAMTSHRPYRKALEAQKAMQIIQENAGSQFDPKLTPIFAELFEEGKFSNIILHSQPDVPLVCCPLHGEIVEVTAETKSGDYAYCPACKGSFPLHSIEGRLVPNL
jgi:HD-GYP domain-containing protein (c-di-GMP phosphodiesterase class II)